MKKEIYKNLGATINQITTGNLKKMQFIVASDKAEQEKIGDFFTKLDTVIELCEEELKNYKEYKKAMLQKLFPKKGEKVPEIRFKGFTDDWEEKKFSDIFNYERPDRYIVNSTEYIDKGIPVLTANKSFILGYTDEKNIYDKGTSIIFDDFTLDNKFVDFPYMVKSSAIKILTTKDGYNIRFAYERLNTTEIFIEGHARHYISIVQAARTLIPSLPEQEKIGSFFQNLDSLIEKQEEQLEIYKNLKKSMLQKMFV